MGWRVIAVVLIWWCATTHAVYIDLPDSGTKCVSEHIQNNVLVLVDYVLVNFHPDAHLKPGVTVSVKVTSPRGDTLYHKENETYGEFPFTTTESGTYLTCFSVQENHYADNHQSVSVEWRVGIAATDWKSVARKEKIEVNIRSSF
ncbi:hypothetical protein SSX86_007528 [Deinandra increscens subsp. villosa]|uniref:GOLD domain-containing protein n=1 Tax=Deinandra increscens subsp. villosa TaxID=3103831 RepID=A0AAP0DE16_9ASTR